jgi:hypothetical protein
VQQLLLLMWQLNLNTTMQLTWKLRSRV